ncbi:MAG: hypothetical protein MRJ93_09520 [Nitrososphaeraceae archaeon]|nr:hypothetical protein [Nitrososphaeraceae archaeon]
MNVKSAELPDYLDRSRSSVLFLEIKFILLSLIPELIKDDALWRYNQSYELKYTNYSVIMNKPKGLVFLTAVYIDV